MLLDQIAAAFDRQNYKLTAQLLKTFLKQSPQDPWGQFYRARLCEVSCRFDEAKAVYQHLLRTVTHPKIISYARQGIQRVDDQQQLQRQQAIAQATADPENAESGLLILEAIPSEARTQAAHTLAQIFNLDVYTARLQAPNRGWKIYRMGAIGELNFYTQQLKAANIPAFCVQERSLRHLSVFEVQYFLDHDPQPIVICHNEQGQLGSLTFDWSEISQRVEGMLPIFERVIDTSMRQGVQRQRKEQTQDYAQICDLHLPSRNCILRLCDWRYRFDQGIEFAAFDVDKIKLDQQINRLHWNHLITFLNEQSLQKIVWSDFAVFVETAIGCPALLKRLPHKINSFGQESSLWNSAFHLYSCLAFLRET